MRWLPALLSIGLLAACATTKPVDPIPRQGSVQRTVTWVITDNPGGACDQALGKPLIGARNACARLRGNECTIYTRAPKSEDDRYAILLLGHEALHCFAGHFHYAVN
jgi:hypothetical protein